MSKSRAAWLALPLASFGVLAYFQLALSSLRADNAKLKAERGDLTLKDPTKINARLVFTDGKTCWRWRIYTPTDCYCGTVYSPPASVRLIRERVVRFHRIKAGEYTFEFEMKEDSQKQGFNMCVYDSKGFYPDYSCDYKFKMLDEPSAAGVNSDLGPDLKTFDVGAYIMLLSKRMRIMLPAGAQSENLEVGVWLTHEYKE